MPQENEYIQDREPAAGWWEIYKSSLPEAKYDSDLSIMIA
jgi:hypothetical protein